MPPVKRRDVILHTQPGTYEFFDKKCYQRHIENLYSISGCHSPENLAAFLDIPGKDVSEAMQKLIIPQEWVYRIHYRILEIIDKMIDKTKTYSDGDFSQRYFDFMSHTDRNLLERFKNYAESSFFAEDPYGTTEDELIKSFKLMRQLIESHERKKEFQ